MLLGFSSPRLSTLRLDSSFAYTIKIQAELVLALPQPQPFPAIQLNTRETRYHSASNFWHLPPTHYIRPIMHPKTLENFLADHNLDFDITPLFATCLVTYCESTPSCNAPSCTAEQIGFASVEYTFSVPVIDDCLAKMCEMTPENLSNPDIAGVGVVYSFYIQFAIACLAALSLIFCMYASRQVPVKDSPKSPPVLVTSIPQIQKFMETMLVTLDDFQRAQCCFAIAIDIAAIVTLHTRTAELTRRDRFAMLFASTAGITPTIMVLTGMMALKERHSALTFWLTCFTWALSLSVVLHPETLRGMLSTRLSGSGSSGNSLKGCDYINPAALCGPQPSVVSATYLVLSSLVGIPLLLTWYLWPSTARLLQHVMPGLRGRLADTPYLTISEIESYTPPLRPRLRRVTTLMVILTYTGCFISFGFFIVNMANDSMINHAENEWTFGQIVAMIVWLPSLLALLNDCIYGLLQGRTKQLPDTMTIVRVKVPRDESVVTMSNEQELQPILPVSR
jgi:hypothetical protein